MTQTQSIQVGTRVWDNLNNAGMTIIEVRDNGTFVAKDDSHHVGNWTLWTEDFESDRFEIL